MRVWGALRVAALTGVIALVAGGATQCGAGSNGGGSGPVIWYGASPGGGAAIAWKPMGQATTGPHNGQEVWLELGTAAVTGAAVGTAAAAAAAHATGKSEGAFTQGAAGTSAAAAAAAANPCPPGSDLQKLVKKWTVNTSGFNGRVRLKCIGLEHMRNKRIVRLPDLMRCVNRALSEGRYTPGTRGSHLFLLNGPDYQAALIVNSAGSIVALYFRGGNVLRCARG